MKRILCLMLTLLIVVFPAAAQTDFDLEAASNAICTALLTSDYATVVTSLNETASAQLNEDILAQTMLALSAQYGALSAVTGAEFYAEQSASVYSLAYENGTLILTIGFDVDGKIAVLNLTPGGSAPESTERPLPEGVNEIPLTLYPDSDHSLSGVILTPANADEHTPYVVFIHGSGPSDMDETMGPNKIFRDIAYDLAAAGIGSLRFDKITYAHPELSVLTVTDEYLEPVSEAVRVLRDNIASDRVYALGHSLGGMLTPWLVQECGFSGGISLAGTPMPLWQMSYDQNLLVIETVPVEQRAALIAQVEAEREIALTLSDMTDEKAASATVFGVNALYQKSIAILDEIAIAEGTEKPFLFLWGNQDFQVNRAAFEAWQENLSGDGPYTYIIYPDLNHLFLPAEEGDSIVNAQTAYSRPASVPEYVADDIAAWIQENN